MIYGDECEDYELDGFSEVEEDDTFEEDIAADLEVMKSLDWLADSEDHSKARDDEEWPDEEDEEISLHNSGDF